MFSNGSFIWNNEAKSLLSEGFTAWVAGQPDNFQNNEKCLMMNKLGRWIDVNCKSKGYVICEKCMNCETAETIALDEHSFEFPSILTKLPSLSNFCLFESLLSYIGVIVTISGRDVDQTKQRSPVFSDESVFASSVNVISLEL